MLKKSNKNIFLILVIVLFSSLLGVTLITPGFKTDLETSLRILLKQPTLFFSTKKIHKNRVIDYSLKVYNGINNRIFNNHSFETIKININFSELQKLQKKKLDNAKYANINVNFKGNTYKAKARLKGDLSQHYGGHKQWSLKLEFKEGKSIFGMEKFSLSIFTERDYPYNFVYYDTLKRFGLISPRFKIVNVNFNGDDWGLMLLEEQFSSSFYAFNELKETPIFRMTNENDFEIRVNAKKIKSGVQNLEDIVKYQGKFETKIYNKKKISKKTNIPEIETNVNLINFFKTIQEESIFQPLSTKNNLINYLNVETFAKAMAITMAFGDTHSMMNNNSRYYVNPYTLKIEPILTDLTHNRVDEEHLKKITNFYGAFYSSLFNNYIFKETYQKTLLDIKNNITLINNRFEEICNKFGKNCFNEIDKDLIQNNLEYLISIGDKLFSYTKINKNSNSEIKFNTNDKYNLIKKKIHFRAYDDGSVDLINLTSEQIKLNKVKLRKSRKCKKNCTLERSIEFFIEPSSFKIPNKVFLDTKLKTDDFDFLEIFYSDENGKNFLTSEIIEKKRFIFDKFSQNYLIDRNDILSEINNNDLIIKKNTYNIKYPIIIPNGKNLIIESGTILNMSKNTYIYILNGNLILNGKKDEYIIIQNDKGEYWNGIFVNSENKDTSNSILKFAKIKDYSYFNNSLVQLTGGINFYNSKVKINNLDLENMISEDGLNIVKSNYQIDQLNIKNSKSDGIDIDFSKGNIEYSNFNNISGDAIDFSGSESKISNVEIDSVEDKAISIGEKSFIQLSNINISNSVIGIASKDSSKAIGENISVNKCKLHDYAVFQKKSYFSEGYLELKNSEGCNQELVELNSFLSVNGKIFKGSKINVKKEYY